MVVHKFNVYVKTVKHSSSKFNRFHAPVLAETIHAVLFTDHHPPAPGLALVCPAYGAPTAASSQHLSAEKKAAAVIPIAPPGHPSFSKPYFTAGRLCLSLVAHAGGVLDALLGLRSKFELD